LVKEYDGKVRVVYMNLVVHPDAVQMAHQYGCAAGMQKKFLAYKNAFWEKGFGAYAASGGRDRSSLGEEAILKWVGDAGLDAAKLKTDANSEACKQRVAADVKELEKFKVNGTPGFFINGTFVGGGLPKEAFKQIIDEKLAAAAKTNLTGAAYYDKEIAAKGLKTFRSKLGDNPPPPKKPTRDDAIAFLEKAWAQQKQQLEQQEAEEQDPDAIFAVDIKEPLRAGQVEGANSATVTVVEAWDFA
jgi:hypothetical protein